VRVEPIEVALVRVPRTDSGLPVVRTVATAAVSGLVRAALTEGGLSGVDRVDVDRDDRDGVDRDGVDPVATGTGAGAMPQTEQNPSSMVPVHPGRAHALIRRTLSLRSPAGTD
jgi:hypothetical protein